MKKLAATADKKGKRKSALLRRPLHHVVSEPFKSALSGLGEAVKHVADLQAGAQPGIFQNYKEGRIWLILKLKLRAGVFGTNESDAAIGIEFAHVPTGSEGFCSILARNPKRTQKRRTDDGQHYSMFVGDISLDEFVEAPAVSSRVHFYFFKEAHRFPAVALSF